ncbi:hypothetical protein FHG87_018816 [Trinorchestia longiramus]|nr:hypothetical protein FHG87_018816 [Trinorchestia longiramus]
MATSVASVVGISSHSKTPSSVGTSHSHSNIPHTFSNLPHSHSSAPQSHPSIVSSHSNVPYSHSRTPHSKPSVANSYPNVPHLHSSEHHSHSNVPQSQSNEALHPSEPQVKTISSGEFQLENSFSVSDSKVLDERGLENDERFKSTKGIVVSIKEVVDDSEGIVKNSEEVMGNSEEIVYLSEGIVGNSKRITRPNVGRRKRLLVSPSTDDMEQDWLLQHSGDEVHHIPLVNVEALRKLSGERTELNLKDQPHCKNTISDEMGNFVSSCSQQKNLYSCKEFDRKNPIEMLQYQQIEKQLFFNGSSYCSVTADSYTNSNCDSTSSFCSVTTSTPVVNNNSTVLSNPSNDSNRHVTTSDRLSKLSDVIDKIMVTSDSLDLVSSTKSDRTIISDKGSATSGSSSASSSGSSTTSSGSSSTSSGSSSTSSVESAASSGSSSTSSSSSDTSRGNRATSSGSSATIRVTDAATEVPSGSSTVFSNVGSDINGFTSDVPDANNNIRVAGHTTSVTDVLLKMSWTFHVTNVLLHACVTFSYVTLLRCASVTRLSSLLSGGVFALHPVHCEAVASLVGRAELLSALCFTRAVARHLDNVRLRRSGLVSCWSLYRVSLCGCLRIRPGCSGQSCGVGCSGCAVQGTSLDGCGGGLAAPCRPPARLHTSEKAWHVKCLSGTEEDLEISSRRLASKSGLYLAVSLATSYLSGGGLSVIRGEEEPLKLRHLAPRLRPVIRFASLPSKSGLWS